MDTIFKFNKDLITRISCQNEFNIIAFAPKIGKLYKKNEKKSLRKTLFRLYISLLTFNKTKVYLVTDKNGKVIHTSYTICRNFKYRFMEKNEILIGPCSTEIEYRGKGIYPYVLNYIINNTNNVNYYLIIKPDNNSSIKGAEKAGFEITDRKINKSKFLNCFIEHKS